MKRNDILKTAIDITSKDRQNTYGKPEKSFEKIANLWTGYLENYKLPDGTRLNATDVAVLLALLKVARIATSPNHTDNWIDLAGYAACGGEIATEEKE